VFLNYQPSEATARADAAGCGARHGATELMIFSISSQVSRRGVATRHNHGREGGTNCDRAREEGAAMLNKTARNCDLTTVLTCDIFLT